MSNPLIAQLNQAFCTLPGVGNKSAQRFVYHLLEKNKQGGIDLANKLLETMTNIKQCGQCRALTESDYCHICQNIHRDKTLVCIVEASSDIDAIEQSQSYNGLYFVLNGYLSPIDGIGANELGLDILNQYLAKNDIKEVILATNATMEGQITAHYLSDMVQNYNIKLSQISHGIPLGGELGYADINTISHAINSRKNI